MRDVELYRTSLGLIPPWTVRSVDLDVKVNIAGKRRGVNTKGRGDLRG